MNEETGRMLPDVLAPGLKAIFCGLNPGQRAAAAGHHFEGRGNRFWPVLHRAGFTSRLLTPQEDRDLPALGYGLTTVVARATASARELSRGEYLAAADDLQRKLELLRPRCVAFLGKAAYLAISGRPSVDWARRPRRSAARPSGCCRIRAASTAASVSTRWSPPIASCVSRSRPDQAASRLRWNSAATAAATSRTGDSHRPAPTDPVMSET